LSAWLLSAWLVAAAALLAYGLLIVAARQVGMILPSVVPSFHFFFYLKAGVAMLFGLGLVAIARHTSAHTASLVCAALLVIGAPTYLGRADFGPARQDALSVAGSPAVQVSEWLREHANTSDVVLASDRDAAVIVGPSGAKVVTTTEGFSNPYVDRAPRVEARTRMFAAIEQGDAETFGRIAREYRVTWILSRVPLNSAFDHAAVAFHLALERDDVRLYRVEMR
jgi:hypothetical protein